MFFSLETCVELSLKGLWVRKKAGRSGTIAGGVDQDLGNNFECIILIFARRKVRATQIQPKPYFTLFQKPTDDASAKYFVGQLISAIV